MRGWHAAGYATWGVHVWGCETRSTDELYVSLTQTIPTILWRALLLRLARPVDHVYIP